MEDKLSIWLNDQLEEHGWSMRELARRAGVSGASISLLISGQMSLSADMSRKLAQALDVPLEEVMRRAGILPPEPPETPSLIEAMRHFARLSKEQQKQMVIQMKALADAEEEARETARTATATTTS
jgi:transcriptional regulator with XRE-family HTH domain